MRSLWVVVGLVACGDDARTVPGAADAAVDVPLGSATLVSTPGGAGSGPPAASYSFEIGNTGPDPSGLIAVSLAGDTAFSIATDTCSTRGLRTVDTCEIVVDKTATGIATVTSTVTVSASPGGSLELAITSGPPASGYTLSPGILTFDPTTVGDRSAPQTLTFTSYGASASPTLATNLPSSEFEIVSDGCNGQSLQFQQSCEIAIRFSPTMTGMQGANFHVAIGAGAGLLIAQLQGTGL